jgi:hypothetical protein
MLWPRVPLLNLVFEALEWYYQVLFEVV